MDKNLQYHLPLLKLDSEDEVNYALVKTLQNKRNDSTLLRDFEDQLYDKMLQRFDMNSKAFNPMDFFFPVDSYEAEAISPRKFQHIISQQIVPPFVVKNFLKGAKAIQQWDFNYFRDQYPDALVAYGTLYGDGHVEDGLFGKMEEILRLVEAEIDDSVYINNTAQIFKEHPELLKDLSYEKLKQLYHPMAVNVILQLFMGGPKTGAPLHCANEFNSFLMIQGRKKWTFIHPDYSYALKASLSVNALNAVTAIEDHTKSFEYFEEHAPLYNCLPKYVVELDPGDMLVFSPWWWHAVENIVDRSIAVATRWTALKRDFFPRGNITFDNIQRSNPLYQSYSKVFMNAVAKGELLGDKELFRETFGKHD